MLFEKEKELLSAFDRLKAKEVYPRRYFYPSLNNLPYLTEKFDCPISEDVSKRIACMPLYVGLEDHNIEMICKEIV